MRRKKAGLHICGGSGELSERDRQAIFNLQAILIEWEIEEMTPEEIRAELIRQGVDIEAEAARLRERLAKIRACRIEEP